MSAKLNGNSTADVNGNANGTKSSSEAPDRKILGGIGTHVVHPLIKGVVLFFGDGDESNQIIRDYLAKQGTFISLYCNIFKIDSDLPRRIGFVVLGYDYFDRDGADGGKPPKGSRTEFEEWAKTHQEHFKESLEPWWTAVQETYGEHIMGLSCHGFLLRRNM